MSEEKYNGWTNYETWVINIWIDNDRDTYHMFRDVVNLYDWENKTYEFSKVMQNYYENQAENLNLKVGALSDLLNGSLRAVNWYELASHILEDYKDED